MKKFVIALVFCAATFLPLRSQSVDWNHYTPLVAQAPIPDDMLVLASQQYEASRKERGFDTIADVRERITREQFLLQSTFVIRELLQSGKVLFNDPLTVYCNQMKDFLLRDNEAVRKKIRIYVVKSPAVNAFATTDGILFVNVGLLAHLTNEAQLAFVLCHEIQHYIKQHPINERVETDRMDRNQTLARGTSLEDRLLAKNQYSRELETEADELGLELYLTTPYSIMALDEAFDILQYSHLPFSKVEFDKGFFQTSNLVWPETYWLDSVTPISPRDEFDEVRSTHPSIKDRRANIWKRAGEVAEEGRIKFMQKSEAEFAEILKLAQFEMTWWLLDLRHYEEAIYSAYALLKQEPTSYFLHKVIAHALYGLTRYRNEGQFSRVHQDFVDMEGNSQQLHHLLEKMNRASLNTLAIIWVWRVHELAPDDEEVNLIIDHLMRDMHKHHGDVADAMVKTPRPVEVPIVKVPGVSADSVLATKIVPEKVKRRAEIAELGKERAVAVKPKASLNNLNSGSDNTEPNEPEEEKEVIPGTGEHLKHAFADLLVKEVFQKKWADGEEDAKKVEPVLSRAEQAKKSMDFSQVEGKLLIFEPMYVVSKTRLMYTNAYNSRYYQEVDYLKTESGGLEYKSTIIELADLTGINYIMLDRDKLFGSDVSSFNRYSLINYWISEYLADSELELVNLYKTEAEVELKSSEINWVMIVGFFKRSRNPKHTHAFLFLPLNSETEPVFYIRKYSSGTSKSGSKLFLYNTFSKIGKK